MVINWKDTYSEDLKATDGIQEFLMFINRKKGNMRSDEMTISVVK